MKVFILLISIWLASCAVVSECRPGIALIKEEKLACEMSSNPLPGCIRGIFFLTKCKTEL